MARERWTQAEIAALQSMYPDESLSHTEIEQHFGREWGTVKQQAQRLGLRRPYSGLWTQPEIDDLERMYCDEDISREQMTEHFNRTWRSIAGKAILLDLRRPRPNTCQVVRDYFHVIDSDEKAYWLGFVAADGTVVCTGRQYAIVLDLQQRDLHWVTRFRDTIAPGSTIIQHGDRSYAVSIASKEMVQDIMALGVGPNKSATLTWPKIPDPFVPGFLLGYFDGDGSLQKRSVTGRWLWTLLGTQPFLSVARHYIQQHVQVTIREPIRISKHRCQHLYRIHAYGKQAIAIDQALNVSGLGIPRKHLDTVHPVPTRDVLLGC
jgi:hypothetical protein